MKRLFDSIESFNINQSEFEGARKLTMQLEQLLGEGLSILLTSGRVT